MFTGVGEFIRNSAKPELTGAEPANILARKPIAIPEGNANARKRTATMSGIF
jgi:hypothetical protein